MPGRNGGSTAEPDQHHAGRGIGGGLGFLDWNPIVPAVLLLGAGAVLRRFARRTDRGWVDEDQTFSLGFPRVQITPDPARVLGTLFSLVGLSALGVIAFRVLMG